MLGGQASEIIWRSPHLIRPATSPLLSRNDSVVSQLFRGPQLVIPISHPTRLNIRCSLYGPMVVDDLEPDSTVADIKAHIAERLRFPPGRVIHLSSWGVALNDDFKTLQECNLRTGGQLEMGRPRRAQSREGTAFIWVTSAWRRAESKWILPQLAASHAHSRPCSPSVSTSGSTRQGHEGRRR